LPGTKGLSVEQRLLRAWHSDSWWLVFLRPISWLFSGLARSRRRRLQKRFQGTGFSAPVAVIGNISLGGSGKTPLIIALVKALADRGIKAGIVSRGYGGRARRYPLAVSSDTDVALCGDEPKLLALELAAEGCPIVVAPNRAAAVEYLLALTDVDIVLSDDGLQHYAMHRDVEIALIDGARGLGNGRTLPAGPLREPAERLLEVDFVLVNGAQKIPGLRADALVGLQPRVFRHLASGTAVAAAKWRVSKAVHGVAAIGNPQRFAASLESLGLEVQLHSRDDHRALSPSDLEYGDQLPVIITAKDAVKLHGSFPDNLWVLDIEMLLDSQFVDDFVIKAGLGAPGRSVDTSASNYSQD
jgi:tetraacyldisaccharide 4'-kinase